MPLPTKPSRSELSEGRDLDARTLADPAWVGAELGTDPEFVRCHLVTGGTQRPTSDGVEHGVLDILRHLPGHVGGAFWPLRQPPATLGQHALEDRDPARVGLSSSFEIMKHPGAGAHERVQGCHTIDTGRLCFDVAGSGRVRTGARQ